MNEGSPRVVLRPVAEPDLAVLARFDVDPEASAPFQWTGFRSPEARRRRYEENGLLSSEYSVLVIDVDGAIAGFVNWRVPEATRPPGAPYEIGILLFPEFRGRGIGTIAQGMLVDHLFATTTVHRVQATTQVDNDAERRSLERLGFVCEGVMRETAFIDGQWRDGVMYARLRADRR
jgi:RimJ/RimL family protein N-acetyltransferase